MQICVFICCGCSNCDSDSSRNNNKIYTHSISIYALFVPHSKAPVLYALWLRYWLLLMLLQQLLQPLSLTPLLSAAPLLFTPTTIAPFIKCHQNISRERERETERLPFRVSLLPVQFQLHITTIYYYVYIYVDSGAVPHHTIGETIHKMEYLLARLSCAPLFPLTNSLSLCLFRSQHACPFHFLCLTFVNAHDVCARFVIRRNHAISHLLFLSVFRSFTFIHFTYSFISLRCLPTLMQREEYSQVRRCETFRLRKTTHKKKLKQTKTRWR